MRFRTDTSSTGRVVSTLAVLTARTMNLLPENHEAAPLREELARELASIMLGQRGVPQRKVVVRSAERCAVAAWN